MASGTTRRQRISDHHDVDAQIGVNSIDVKFGVDALRTVRASFIQVAYHLAEHTDFRGFLVLVDTTITPERLRQEWKSAGAVLRPDVITRLTVCIRKEGSYIGIPQDPDLETKLMLEKVVQPELGRAGARRSRTDFSFVVFKLLLHRWLASGEPVTADWLARTAGCSYPTVARSLGLLRSVLERKSDRRVTFRWFPHEEFARILAIADRVRVTTRFVDRSGQPRSPEAHLRRLEKLNVPDLAIGGVLGAKQYFSELDLVGTPRLDLSLHSPGKRMDLSFVERLDPALEKVEDPHQPVNVVVHAVRHGKSLFEPREGGLWWADPVECLLDLHEAHLESQAAEFLSALQSRRQLTP